MPTPATDPAIEGAAPAGLLARYLAWSLDAACLLPLVVLLGASRLRHAADAAWAAIDAIGRALPPLLTAAMDPLLEGAPGDAPGLLAVARDWLSDPAMAEGVARLHLALADLVLTPLLLYALVALPWSIGFESSRWQATPGKRALGLRVADRHGRRLRAGHALQRFLASGLSWLTLNIGHAMAALPPRHLALHDRISDTRVLAPVHARVPPWAWAWLGVQVAAGLLLCVWAVVSMQAALQAALAGAMGLA